MVHKTSMRGKIRSTKQRLHTPTVQMGSHNMENVPCLGSNQHNYMTPADIKRNARVVILEQPAPKSLRFRYESEGRFTGSLSGANTNTKAKTYPTIKVMGYVGKCYVYVSCVTMDYPHRPHPHHIVGKEGCVGGVCKLDIPPETMTATFSSIGIRCVKKKDIDESLRIRKRINVDPFHTGYDVNRPTPIDLNVVRLCFQVVVETPTEKVSLQPVVSDPIYNRKKHLDLIITKLSHCVGSPKGGTDVIMLCEKIDKEDIEIRVFEEINGQVVWENHGFFHSSDVHKLVAISFKTPPYCRTDITEPVRVNIQLRRPSDGAAGEPVPFEYVPVQSGYSSLGKKRKSISIMDCDNILKNITPIDTNGRRESYELDCGKIREDPQINLAKKELPTYELPPMQAPSAYQVNEPMGYQLPPLTTTNHLDLPAMNNINPSSTSPTLWNIPDNSKVQGFVVTNVSLQEWNVKPANGYNVSPMWNVALPPNCASNIPLPTLQMNVHKQEDDLCNYEMDINNLSDNFSMSFSLTDLDHGVNTDSLTNLVDKAAESHCQFNPSMNTDGLTNLLKG